MSSLTRQDLQDLTETGYDALGQFTERSPHPTLSVVLGQSGTPVTTVQMAIEESRRSNGGAVLVGAFDMERIGFGEGFVLSESESGALAADVARRAIRDNRNVVFAPHPGDTETPLTVIAAARRAGMRVEVEVLAVSPKLAAAQGFQRSVAEAAPARSDQELVREAAGVGAVLRRIEANAVADAITVYDRSGIVIDRAGGVTASDVFERQRGLLSGADKIALAAAYEEVVEAHERAAQVLPENAQRLRQQAHYLVRQDEGVSLNFDDRYPEHSAISKDLAEQYGHTLARLFDAKDTGAVVRYPELTNAFVAQRVVTLLAAQQGTPGLQRQAESRIHDALMSGASIEAPAVREQFAQEREREPEAVER